LRRSGGASLSRRAWNHHPRTSEADDTFETAAFGDPDGVDIVAGSEDRRAEDVARLHFFGEVAEFPDALYRDTILFFDMAEQRFGDAMLLLIVETELNGIIAVALLGFALQNTVGTGQHDRDGGHDTFSVINAGLAQFFSKKS